MASEKQIAANRRNAQLSSGPRNPQKTRSNALRHGILSREVLISAGEGKESAKDLENLRGSLFADLSPEGALEEFLVDCLVSLMWRMARVLQFENGAIRMRSDFATSEWENKMRGPKALLARVQSGENWKPTEVLKLIFQWSESELNALSRKDPLGAKPELWKLIFSVAEQTYELNIDEFLDIEDWEDYQEIPKQDIQRVIDEACKLGSCSAKEFFSVVRTKALATHQDAKEELERRNIELERLRLVASLPDSEDLEKVRRYEAHLSRQFDRRLHALQRIQGTRMGIQRSIPVVVDMDVNTNGE